MSPLFALGIHFITALPVKVPFDDARTAMESLRRIPALRRLAAPLAFDLHIQPRIYWGMTRPALENMVGIVDGLEFDFVYPVTFTRRFQLLPGIIRESHHTVWFDTRWHSSDGDITHAFRWHETRIFSLRLGPWISLPLVEMPTLNFGSAEWPECPEGQTSPYPADLVHDHANDPRMERYRDARRIFLEESSARYEEARRNGTVASLAEKATGSRTNVIFMRDHQMSA